MNCKQSDHDNPRLQCGYPLPCPFHTVIIDTTKEITTVEVPVSRNLSIRQGVLLKDVALALDKKFNES